MLIISFAWTTEAFTTGNKSCTRRSWNDRYAAMFKAGKQVQAWDKSPRNGGHQVGIISLTRDAYPERTSSMTEADYEAEGLAWLTEQGHLIQGRSPRQFFDDWKAADELVYVVRFQLLSLTRPKPVLGE